MMQTVSQKNEKGNRLVREEAYIVGGGELDNGSALGMVISGKLSEVSFESGVPRIMRFYVCKGKRTVIPKHDASPQVGDVVLSLNIPILPAYIAGVKGGELEKFLKNGSAEYNLKQVEAIGTARASDNINAQSNEIMLLIKHEVANAYAQAKSNDDTEVMDILQNLEFMENEDMKALRKDFDVDYQRYIFYLPSVLETLKDYASNKLPDEIFAYKGKSKE